MHKVMIHGQDGADGDVKLGEFHTREAAEAEAKDWNDRHGYSEQSILKRGNGGSAYVK